MVVFVIANVVLVVAHFQYFLGIILKNYAIMIYMLLVIAIVAA